ncbi:hypothetical protein LEP1GSC168_3026 [Leptospira santarosai str. HAI134]|uniref:Uncharacterized protein n=3 Tax=Leptospira santarosai TaxID=28183 RepID=M6UM44_9LEPT|nr:hypothetical protein LEP1GSC179_1893 [Leptospira santarosai str. MOR084]EKS06536.1 hypothetical protein LEP1GSC071_1185 [Leptospira santarosai str. JET]EMN19431.1 hypothetical protein LEP1GSC063_2594 [Leptospira santarosai serovar Arenal str. MAVJ 401]EMO24373.1 hypothetical protein LEP1GSC168_3026 [Leptospira santarosai str. HAI134]EMO46197.1 hypothetical protein LEP1GSC187_1843 [Leptospira santarosai str. ZUN179]EMO84513.1 hypothetical protein LEP1GSC070_0989 [Leptospira santarosai str. A
MSKISLLNGDSFTNQGFITDISSSSGMNHFLFSLYLWKVFDTRYLPFISGILQGQQTTSLA